jgi:hypothetical protein
VPWCQRARGHGEGRGTAVGTGGRLGADRRAGGEATVGLVGADVEGDLAADAVGLADAADHDLDVALLLITHSVSVEVRSEPPGTR